MPETPIKDPYETEKQCPECAMSPPPRLMCKFETTFAGDNKTRHLECPRCGHTDQDVINAKGMVIIQK